MTEREADPSAPGEAPPLPDAPPSAAARRLRDRAWPGLAAGGLALAIALAAGWSQRVSLAERVLERQLASLHLPARYRVEAVGPGGLVLSHLSVGNPAHPDLVADRVEITAGFGGGVPGIGMVRLVRPRVMGRWQNGRLSLGSLDPLWQGPSTTQPRWPDLNVELVDARVGIHGDAGPVGIGLSGAGNLRGGFAGQLALSAPALRAGQCRAAGHMLLAVAIRGERLSASGPARMARLRCANGMALTGDVQGQVSASLGPAFDRGEGVLRLAGGALAAGGAQLGGLAGEARLAIGPDGANATGRLTARRGAVAGVEAGQLELEGRMRAGSGGRIDGDGSFGGSGLALGKAASQRIDALGRSVPALRDTLAAPLLAKMALALRREMAGARLGGTFTFHRNGQGASLNVPQAQLTGHSGAPLLAVSRAGVVLAAGRAPLMAGAFRSNGAGLPQVTGQVTVSAGQPAALRLAVAPYRAGDAAFAMPELAIAAGAGGAMRIAGQVQVSGALGAAAGGARVRDLSLPLAGEVAGDHLALWHQCASVRFGGLSAGSVELKAGAVRLCPDGAGPVLAYDPRAGLRARLTTPGLALKGQVGDAPLALGAGALRLTYAAGALSASGQGLMLASGASNVQLAAFDASGHGGAFAGHFSGAEVAPAAQPVLLRSGAGNWRYAGGALDLTGLAVQLADTAGEARFGPLAVRDAALHLQGEVITGSALLRDAASDRALLRVDMRHDLASGAGHADLAVDELRFDQALQPDRITPLARGMIANVAGTVRGTGAIDWQGGHVTSHGRIASDGLDFAVALGPVKGVAGEIEFTDLLGLVTAPRQHLRVASINPGIEVTDGVATFALEPGGMLAVEGAHWPFLDGSLDLLPTRLQLGGAVERRFALQVSGIDAAKFLLHLEISNLAATGHFDGRVPLVFDRNGGRIEGGELHARPPGGSLSYVGALSYKDLTPMANYAFRALRALKYREMSIGLGGNIAGEIVTRVSIAGISQGKGASRNFLTRQVARLPLRFNVNIRAPFYQLVTSFKSFYDSSYVADPRTLGLMGADGRAIAEPQAAPTPAPTIQPSDSEHHP